MKYCTNKNSIETIKGNKLIYMYLKIVEAQKNEEVFASIILVLEIIK